MKRIVGLVFCWFLFSLPCWAQQPIFVGRLDMVHTHYILNWKDGQFETGLSRNQMNLSLTARHPGFALKASMVLPRVEWQGSSDLSAGSLVIGDAVFKRKSGGQGSGQQSNQQTKPIDVSLLLKSQLNIDALVPIQRMPGFSLVGRTAFFDLCLTGKGEVDGKQTEGSESISRWFPQVGLNYTHREGPCFVMLTAAAGMTSSHLEANLNWNIRPDCWFGIGGKRDEYRWNDSRVMGNGAVVKFGVVF